MHRRHRHVLFLAPRTAMPEPGGSSNVQPLHECVCPSFRLLRTTLPSIRGCFIETLPSRGRVFALFPGDQLSHDGTSWAAVLDEDS